MHVLQLGQRTVFMLISTWLAASGIAMSQSAAGQTADLRAAEQGANAAPAYGRPRPVLPHQSPAVSEAYDLIYASYGERKLKLDLFRPAKHGQRLPAVVIVHGGGWTSGDKTRFRALAQTLAARGYATAAIEYRLAGEALFPAAIHDCNAAVRFLRANAEIYGIDPNRIGAVGGSAGGHLVGLMAAASEVGQLQGAGGNPGHSARLQAAVIMAGPFDLTSGPIADRSRKQPEHSNTNRWLGKSIDEAPDLYRLASPYWHLSSATAPMLFLHGEFDNPQQNATSRKRLRELGVAAGLRVYQGGKHGCWNQHPWFEAMVDDIDVFLAPILKPGESPAAVAEVPTAWGALAFYRGHLELHVTSPPQDFVVTMPRLLNPIGRAYLRGKKENVPLTLRAEPNGWSIKLPEDLPPDDEATIVVETVGQPRLSALTPIATADDQGVIHLPAHEATTHGSMLRYEPQPHKNTLGYWTKADDWCHWRLFVDKPGNYRLTILQGCGLGQGGSEVVAQLGDERLVFTVEETGHFQNFKRRDLGQFHVAAAGVYSLELRPRKLAHKAVMDVRQARLIPLD